MMTHATSFARGTAVVLTERDRFNMVSNWIDAIVLTRSQKRHFNVYARKYAETMDTSSSCRWLTLDSTPGLRDPDSLRRAIDSAAGILDIEVDWEVAIGALAEIDWVIAAIIAADLEWALPAPPKIETLAQQRAGCARATVDVGVEWGYEPHSIRVPMRDWLLIVAGGTFLAHEVYTYEGERFTADWQFNASGPRTLLVSYDEGGTGFEGRLEDARVLGPQLFGHDVARLLCEASRHPAEGAAADRL